MAGGWERGDVVSAIIEACREDEPQLTQRQRARFRRLVGSLNTLRTELQRTIPGANYYLDDDNFCLLSGLSHDERDRPRQDRIIEVVRLAGSGGGGW